MITKLSDPATTNLDVIGVVGADNQSVQVRELILLVVLDLDLVLLLQVLALVVEDGVDLFGGVSAVIGPKHDVVLRVTINALGIHALGVQLQVSAATVESAQKTFNTVKQDPASKLTSSPTLLGIAKRESFPRW